MLRTKMIHAISRASVKIGDSYYTLEYGEDREVPDDFDMNNLDQEKRKLWDDCNNQVDGQIEEIYNFIKSNRK